MNRRLFLMISQFHTTVFILLIGLVFYSKNTPAMGQSSLRQAKSLTKFSQASDSPETNSEEIPVVVLSQNQESILPPSDILPSSDRVPSEMIEDEFSNLSSPKLNEEVRSQMDSLTDQLGTIKALESSKSSYLTSQLAVTVTTGLVLRWYGPAYLMVGTKKLFPLVYAILFGSVPEPGTIAYYFTYLPALENFQGYVYTNSTPILIASGAALIPVIYYGFQSTHSIGKNTYGFLSRFFPDKRLEPLNQGKELN